MKTRNRKSKQSLGYGSLEPKRMLAGNVQANVQGEQIFIRGDQLDNQIEITADNGQIRIRGLDGTTVNNRFGSVFVGNSTTVSGSDRVSSEFSGGLRIHTGPGNDTLIVNDIRLNDLSIIYGGTGDDLFDISSSEFFGSAIVQTFDGDDDVTFTDVRVTDTLFAATLNGEDSLTVEDSESSGGALLATGADNDSVRLDGNVHLGSRQIVLTNDGDDIVEIQNPTVGTGTLEIYTGNGDDEVFGELTAGSIAGDVIIAGQADDDSADLTIDNNFNNQISIRGFEFTGEVVFENAQEVESGFATFLRANDSFFVADFVEFTQSTRIGTIDFLGSYENSAAPVGGDDLVIQIFEGGIVDNEFGTYQAPVGDAVATFDIGDNANRVDTGETWTVLTTTRRIFSYSAEVDFTFDANVQYWISIYSNNVNQADDFYTLGDEIELEDPMNGAATVLFPTLDFWFPNTSAKTHFTLRS